MLQWSRPSDVQDLGVRIMLASHLVGFVSGATWQRSSCLVAWLLTLAFAVCVLPVIML